MTCGLANVTAQASAVACASDTARNSATCMPTTGARGGLSGYRTPKRSTNGNATASSIHLGVVEATAMDQSIGKPCVTDTWRASSALIAPSARQTPATARVAIVDGNPGSCNGPSFPALLSGVLPRGPRTP